ncbi:MAG: DUF4364 family protein [Eubacteriales bacterium]|jgi:DNA-binding PadR family transcriptional regulator
MIDSSHSLYKLIVLYILNKVTFPLTNAQISDLVLSKGYTNYFHLQDVLSEMLESGLVQNETKNDTIYYTMTDSGKETLQYFENEISPEIRREISEYLSENAYELRSRSSVIADYSRCPEGGYTVTCSAREGDHTLIELKLNVPTESSARAVADKWKTKAQECYASVMKLLL